MRLMAYITIFKMTLLNFLNFIFLIKPPAQLNIFKCSPVILQLVNHISTKQQQKTPFQGRLSNIHYGKCRRHDKIHNNIIAKQCRRINF